MATEPDNKNFLSPIGFQFSINRMPNVNYFCTAVALPDVSLPSTAVETPFVAMPQPGDKLEYGQLQLTFRIDEDMKNYSEIYDWMVGIGYPDNFEQRHPLQRATFSGGDTIFSDATLVITTNQYKPNIAVNFVDLAPTNISGVEFNIEQNDVAYMQAVGSFIYRKFELIQVG